MAGTFHYFENLYLHFNIFSFFSLCLLRGCLYILFRMQKTLYKEARREICRQPLYTWCYMTFAVYVQKMSTTTQQSCELCNNSSQFRKNLFCTCNNPNGKNVCEVCNFLFVLEMSVCFRVFVELDYLPACKILIAHCIYEGSLKT